MEAVSRVPNTSGEKTDLQVLWSGASVAMKGVRVPLAINTKAISSKNNLRNGVQIFRVGIQKPSGLRYRDHKRSLKNKFNLSLRENTGSTRFSNKFWKSSTNPQLQKIKKWICYGKRVGTDSLVSIETNAPIGGANPTSSLIQHPTKLGQLGSEIPGGLMLAPMTQIIYDQQNMIQCFQDRNFYRLMFAFLHSMYRSFQNQLPSQLLAKGLLTEDEQQPLGPAAKPGVMGVLKVPQVLISNKKRPVVFSLIPLDSLFLGSRATKKIILFARSEVKRFFRKILFIKPESLLFSQIFLIPLAGFFGILYTFWTFSVSSTVTFNDYTPIAQQKTSRLQKRIQLMPNRKSEIKLVRSSTDWSQISAENFEEGTLGLEELPFFTSYKVDWSPTRGLADFLRFTNTASKIFILWASLTVFRSLRPVKANRPEMRIQTRFLRPFQNRKRFRDLEGIEKFSGVLTTLTESIQGSFKDPLFYLVLALPNLPFFQPFQKAIGKFRFFLFYGKQTEVLRKPISLVIGLFFPKQKQAQTYPKGYLFIGPPGTGKTLLAQAIAGESKVNLICLSASEIQKQLDIGTRIGALRLRNLFEEARTLTPCILFFDEIDTLGRARQILPESNLAEDSAKYGTQQNSMTPGITSGAMGSKNQNWLKKGSNKNPDPKATESRAPNEVGSSNQIDLKLFTEFLVQMDSFSVKDGFLVIGTTNFLSSLDPAFIRSGRFDRILGLTYPPKQTRIAILKLHIKKKGNLFDPTIPWAIFGLKTKDLSPADLAKVVNESSLYLLNHLDDQTRLSLGSERFRPGFSSQSVLGTPMGATLQSSIAGTQEQLEMANKKTEPTEWTRVFKGLQNIFKDIFVFKPGLIHTSASLRQGLVKILESKR